MNFFIDLATLNSVSAAFYAILLLLLFLFWSQNRDIDATIWWCGFPLFRLANAVISSDTIDYDAQIIIYLGNLSIVLSNTFFLIGCLKFAEMRIEWRLIAFYLAIYIGICVYQYSEGAELSTRAQAVVIFEVIPFMASIYALSTLSNMNYIVEKYFIIFWTAFPAGVFAFWALINFEFGNPKYGASVVLSLALVYLSHIFMSLGLIIMSIARQREQISREIENHVTLEQNLEHALEGAQIAYEEKNQFLANMSHELRTPLNAIIGFSESMKLGLYGKLNEKQNEYVENIYAGGELLLKLITDLLDLSNVEEGKVEIIREDVGLEVLFDKTLPLLQEIIGAEEDRLVIENALNTDKKDAIVNTDQIRIKQILINFVSNAVKYSEATTPITITLAKKGKKYYRINVTDEGMGIPEEQYDNIFKPFNRAANKGSDVEGIGVGLSIAKRLIEEMDGRIGFKSKIGKGSTFWIDIPAASKKDGVGK